MRITRFPSLSESQFLGCNSAFVDTLFGELNAAAGGAAQVGGSAQGRGIRLRDGISTGAATGALLALDRWAALVNAFGPHLELARWRSIVDEGPARVQAAEDLLGRVNALLDGAQTYGEELVEGCLLAWRSLSATFDEERAAAAQSAQLGPMLPEDYREARRIFLEDLAAR